MIFLICKNIKYRYVQSNHRVQHVEESYVAASSARVFAEMNKSIIHGETKIAQKQYNNDRYHKIIKF